MIIISLLQASLASIKSNFTLRVKNESLVGDSCKEVVAFPALASYSPVATRSSEPQVRRRAKDAKTATQS